MLKRTPRSALKGHNSGTSWLTRSYNFIDKDPEVDKFRTLWQKERIKESDLAVLAGLHTATINNMFGGVTMAPRHSTFAKIAGALGYEYTLKRIETPNYETEIEKAKEERADYRRYLAKKAERENRSPKKKAKTNGHK